MRSAGGQALVVATDVTRHADPERMIEMVTREAGPIDLLVNNAGLCYHRPALDVPETAFRAVFEVNLFGLWHCAQVIGGGMVERRRGVIVNIGSISALIVNRPQM